MGVHRDISITEGAISPICWIFGKITSSGLVFMIVHRRCTGSLAPNILRRGTTNKFCSDVDGVPVRL